jgi:CRISPR-associated protein Cmr2
MKAINKCIYLAITIGPIFKTMELAKHTYELWAASYLFSFIMGAIAKRLSESGKGELIVPSKIMELEDIKEIRAGIYPDRILFKKKSKKTKISIDKLIEDVWKDLERKNKAIESQDVNAATQEDQAPLIAFLKESISIQYVEWEMPDDENPFEKLYPLLDTLEQRLPYSSEFAVNYLREFLAKIKACSIFKEIFENDPRFKSVPEIAAYELKSANPEKFDEIFNIVDEKLRKGDGKPYESINEQLKKAFPKKAKSKSDEKETSKQEDKEKYFRFYHKYMAVVQADGDNIGKLMQALFLFGGLPAIKDFSALLMDYGKEASKSIIDYGGVPVYVGGDDLLFFAPTKSGDKTLFRLLDEIDQSFLGRIDNEPTIQRAISEWNKRMELKGLPYEVLTPTLSFGVEISYTKHPLEEARSSAYDRLFFQAKKQTGKNALAVELLKHAGHGNTLTLNKRWNSYPIFLELLTFTQANEELLSSVQHKLLLHRPLLLRILYGRPVPHPLTYGQLALTQCYTTDELRMTLLNNFRDEFFKDLIHKREPIQQYISAVFWLLNTLYEDESTLCNDSHSAAEKALDQTIASLRLAQFYTM